MRNLFSPEDRDRLRARVQKLSPKAREAVRKLVKLRLDRMVREMQAAPVTDLSTSEGLTLGTADRPAAPSTDSPTPRYLVLRVIRNPAADSLTRGRRLTRAALRVVKG